MNLIDDGWTLGAKTSPAAGMLGISFELGDLSRFFIYISEKPAGGFAVETDGRNQLIVALDVTRPSLGI